MKPQSAALRPLFIIKSSRAEIQASTQHKDPSVHEPPSVLFTPVASISYCTMCLLAIGLYFRISENYFPH